MNLYLSYFKTEVNQPDDNPPIGIVLGARKDELLMEYALEGKLLTNFLWHAINSIYPNEKNCKHNLTNCWMKQQTDQKLQFLTIAKKGYPFS